MARHPHGPFDIGSRNLTVTFLARLQGSEVGSSSDLNSATTRSAKQTIAQKKLESVDFEKGAEGRLSIAECRALLGDEARALSDDEIDTLRQSAETMAHVLIEIFLESRFPGR